LDQIGILLASQECTGGSRWEILQHRVAVAELVELDQRGKGIEWLAEELDVNADWLTRKL
jgi:hypothetical protein